MKKEKMTRFVGTFPTENMDDIMKTIEECGLMEDMKNTCKKIEAPPSDQVWRECVVNSLLIGMTESEELSEKFTMFATSIALGAIVAREEFNQNNFEFLNKPEGLNTSDDVKRLLNAIFGKGEF